jgi:carboxyl-terminal processing protease
MYRYLALALLFVATLAPSRPVAPAPTPVQEAQVRQSVSLLLSTFYRKLDPRAVVVAEHASLAKRGLLLPRVPARLDEKSAPDAAVAQLDAAVAGGTPRTTATYAALRAIALSAHDRWTAFFTPSEYKAFDEILDPAKTSGIGVLMDVDASTKYVRAFFVVPDAPADKAGMKSGDLIESINGESTHGFTIADARKRLLGVAGTDVKITIVRPSASAPQELALVRAAVTPPTVYFTMLPDKLAYVYVAAFGTDTTHEFKTAIARSEAAGARAYVVDLRNDGGGIVGTAISLASQFVQSGPLVSIESNGGQIETYEADDEAIAPKPLVLLVNGYSASASEIMAAAISESGAGVLVGTRTFGKGVVQTVSRFSDGGAIKITTGRYYTPLNHDINGHGILPAFVVPENAGAIFGTPANDAQLARAVAILTEQLAKS